MTSPGDLTSRKPLDAAFVGKINQAAMKALGDVAARRKWADSRPGSPLTTNILCADIARLNMVNAELLELARQFEKVAEYQIRQKTRDGDDEGARMTAVTLNLIRSAIYKAEGGTSAAFEWKVRSAMNQIEQMTKDCPREDCSITGGQSGTSTCMGWTPSYDKHGNRTDRGDPNTFTTFYRCSVCKRRWIHRTQYGETQITEAPPS